LLNELRMKEKQERKCRHYSEVYSHTRGWANMQDNKIIEILKNELGEEIRLATETEDMEQATDLVSKSGLRISVRCRKQRFESLQDLSLRYELKTKAGTIQKTEFEKLLQGRGDIYFYCYVKPDGELSSFKIMAIDEIREQLRGIKQTIEAGRNGTFQILDNGDGSKFLFIYFPVPFFYASVVP